jgi:hypothetical protein
MKKETLEEAAENSFLANKLENSNAVEKAHYIAGFRESAKWQQERSYSDEEVENILREWSLYKIGIELEKLANEIPNILTYKEWFEQFKKK